MSIADSYLSPSTNHITEVLPTRCDPRRNYIMGINLMKGDRQRAGDLQAVRHLAITCCMSSKRFFPILLTPSRHCRPTRRGIKSVTSTLASSFLTSSGMLSTGSPETSQGVIALTSERFPCTIVHKVICLICLSAQVIGVNLPWRRKNGIPSSFKVFSTSRSPRTRNPNWRAPAFMYSVTWATSRAGCCSGTFELTIPFYRISCSVTKLNTTAAETPISLERFNVCSNAQLSLQR